MVALALLVTVALVKAKMPSPLVPVMLPELVTLAKPVSAKIPLRPPVMLPAALVTVASPRKTPLLVPESEVPVALTATPVSFQMP
jgi:hypothetical protein